VDDWPHPGWHHADRVLSDTASRLLGSQCYVCPGYDSGTLEPLLMIADGWNRPVLVNLVEEIPAGVAELAKGLGTGLGLL